MLALAVALLGAALVSACAAIWGFEDAVPIPDAALDGSQDVTLRDGAPRADATVDAAPDVGRDATMEATADAGADAVEGSTAEDASEEPPIDAADAGDAGDPCTTTTPDLTATYVSATGSDILACGSMGSPCATITYGLSRAGPRNSSVVNVAEGAYAESLQLINPGITIVGGWTAPGDAGAWVKDESSNNPQSLLVIEPPAANTTVLADSLGGEATLCTLTLESKPAANPGETLYGVFASGASTTLHLRSVIVFVQPGGSGSPGTTGDGGATGSASGCSPPGNGSTPSGGGPGGAGAAGFFDDAGYVPGNGANGGSGSTGSNGTGGHDGGCVQCDLTCGGFLTCVAQTTSESCGGPGTAGCGGGAGGAGVGGGGGGGSVALFVWNATVTVDHSALTAKTGGNGAVGGSGGDGGAGANGATGGAGPTCNTACLTSPSCEPGTPGSGSGGASGGKGGAGSSGGSGGGGSGGFSCAVVIHDAGSAVTITNTTLAWSAGGAGAGGAPGGGNGNDAGVCSF